MRNNYSVPKLFTILFLICIVGALAFGKFPLLPNSVQKSLSDLTVNLGLDLQGGLHLEYEIDLSGVEEEAKLDALNAVQAVIERRVNAFGVGEPTVQIASRGAEKFLIVEIPGIREIEEAKDIIKETPFLEFREERTAEELEAYFSPLNEENKSKINEALTRLEAGEEFTAVKNTLNPTPEGVEVDQEEVYVKKGELVAAPAVESILFDTEIPENTVHKEVIESEIGYHIVKKGVAKGEYEEVSYELITLIKQSDRTNPAATYKPTELTGEHLKRAEVTYSQAGLQQPEVSIFFNSEGDKLFGEITERNKGKTVAIVVDGEYVSVPNVSQAIYGGQAQITGARSLQEAQSLAGRLNEGALPVPINLASQQSVEASLGAQSLTKSLKAGLWGLALVMLYMIFYYRFFGLIAAGAIGFYALTIVAILKVSSTFPPGLAIVLTLSGIAGLILSIGMAVDANILIYERIHEELRRGRRLHHAVEEGFSRAWSAILDGNLSTILTCLILLIIGTGFVKGFALILSIGVLLSMFTAVVLVKVVIRASAGQWLSKNTWLIGRGLSKYEDDTTSR